MSEVSADTQPDDCEVHDLTIDEVAVLRYLSICSTIDILKEAYDKLRRLNLIDVSYNVTNAGIVELEKRANDAP